MYSVVCKYSVLLTNTDVFIASATLRRYVWRPTITLSTDAVKTIDRAIKQLPSGEDSVAQAHSWFESMCGGYKQTLSTSKTAEQGASFIYKCIIAFRALLPG